MTHSGELPGRPRSVRRTALWLAFAVGSEYRVGCSPTATGGQRHKYRAAEPTRLPRCLSRTRLPIFADSAISVAGRTEGVFDKRLPGVRPLHGVASEGGTLVKCSQDSRPEGPSANLFRECTVVARLLPEVSTSGLRMRDYASMDGSHLAFQGFDRRRGRKRESHPDLGLF